MTRTLAAHADELEAEVHVAFRRAGGDGARWQRRDWLAMVGALVALEDRLEVERLRFDRSPLRTLRRTLEDVAEAPRAARRVA